LAKIGAPKGVGDTEGNGEAKMTANTDWIGLCLHDDERQIGQDEIESLTA